MRIALKHPQMGRGERPYYRFFLGGGFVCERWVHLEFYLQREKAVIRCLAEMFGCRTGTLSKSSLFSHGPPNTRLQQPVKPKRGQRAEALKNYFILGLSRTHRSSMSYS